jgi:transcriptional regulator with PAS, ATPase and Fis domain
VDVRVIAATNVHLAQSVQEGKFRDDLFYRLNVINILIPPLRERKEDISILTRHFIEHLSHELKKEVEDISEGAIRMLLDYHWPGNVRELENAVERAIVTCKNKVLSEDDFGFIGQHDERRGLPAISERITLEELERQAIVSMLQQTHGNVKEAASILGIDRSTLYDKLKKYHIERNPDHPEM